MKIGSIVVAAGPFALLADTKELDDVEVNNLTADQDALALAARWAAPPLREPVARRAQGAAQGHQARPARVRGAAVRRRHHARRERRRPAGAAVEHRAARGRHAEGQGGWRATLDGRNWQAPLGPALTFDDLNVVAVFGPKQVTLTSIEGKAGRGTMKGTAKATWGSGIRVDGEFSLTGGDLASLMTTFTRDFSATGNRDDQRRPSRCRRRR